jgi:adenylate cyclase
MKQVTVLFCDIVGSTPLTDRLGSEGMRDLVSSFLETSLAEVHRYGGTAPQFLGDGFMAVFGAPVTQEDHVQRALLAALGVQGALSGAADPLAAIGKDRLDLPVRIGIHTGQWCSARSPAGWRWISPLSAIPPISLPGFNRPPSRGPFC